MTEILNDRSELDEALDDPDLTLLVLSGDEGTQAGALHAKAEEIEESGCRTFWIRDLALLTETERAEWLDGPGRYAVLCGQRKGVKWEHWISVQGPLEELMTPKGKPSASRIQDVFASCTAEED
jgi:hypothetical protein